MRVLRKRATLQLEEEEKKTKGK